MGSGGSRARRDSCTITISIRGQLVGDYSWPLGPKASCSIELMLETIVSRKERGAARGGANPKGRCRPGERVRRGCSCRGMNILLIIRYIFIIIIIYIFKIMVFKTTIKIMYVFTLMKLVSLMVIKVMAKTF